MRKLLAGFMILTTTTSVIADETIPNGIGDCRGYPSRDDTTLSMMGWGITLVVGIAALVCLIPNKTTKTTTTN